MSSKSSTPANVNASARSQYTASAPASTWEIWIGRFVRRTTSIATSTRWLHATPDSRGQVEVSVFSTLDDAGQQALRAVVEDSAHGAATSSDSKRRKIGELFGGYMNEAQLEQQGLQPLAPELARIEHLEDKSALPALFAHYNALGVRTVYVTNVGQDARDSTKYAVILEQAAWRCPTAIITCRTTRACADPQPLSRARAEALCARRRRERAADAQAVLLLETRIAQAQWTKVENRDPVKTYTKVALGDLAALNARLRLALLSCQADIDGRVDYVIVSSKLPHGARQDIA